MAKKHESPKWKSIVPAAGLVGLVLLILAATALVSTDREPELMQREAEPSVAPPQDPEPLIEEIVPPAATVPSAATVSLRERADQDYRRLAGMEDRFTAHLILACDWDNARRHMEGAGWDDNLYLLPAEYHGQDCFRLCWGVYPTREAAEAEGEILPYLAREFPDRTPKALVEIRP